MLQVEWGEYKLQEGCAMDLVVSEDNEDPFVVFWLSKASKLSWFTGFFSPEIKVFFYSN